LVGYDRETILGSLPSLIKDPEAVEQAEDQLRQLLSNDDRDTVTFEVTVHPSDGDPIICEDQMGVLPYEGNQFNGSVGTLRDITDRKERERKLARTREFMTNIERLADVGAWEYDPDTEALVLTDGTRRIFGLEPDVDLTVAEVFECFHPEDRNRFVDRFTECLETGTPYEVELRLTTTGGGVQRRVTAWGERVPEYGDGSVVRGYLRDTTDRKRIQRAPERRRDLVTGIMETVPVGISVHNADGSIRLMNERMESLCGRRLEETGADPSEGSRYDLVDKHGKPFGPGETPLDRVVSQETVVHNQIMGSRGPSGERVWLSVSGTPQYNDDGELEWTIFAFEEITRRRELKNELSEVFDRISDAFFALDGEFRFTHVNRRAEELLEASEDELIGETLCDMCPEAAELDRIRDRFDVAMDTQTPRSLELYYQPLDFWVEATIYPSESGVSVYFRDMTQRKNRDQELRELKGQYEALAENFPDGAVFLIDTELRYVRAGGQGLSNVGLSPDDVEGATPHALFLKEIADETCRHYEKALDGNATTYEQTYGGERYRIQTGPVWTGGEEIEYAMAVSRNITERAENKRELERQNERLEEFTSIVSHDLRNPLQVANGRLSLVREECESDHINDAARALDRMEELIEDLLALAREGERVDATDPVGVEDVAGTSWQTVDTKQAVLETDVSRAVRADRSRLRQLFENLYHSAVEHGGDDVTVSVGSMNRGFYVADTGRGIPDADRKAVFEAGYSTSDEGTGFGLRIVSQVADAHGWEVTATESEQGGARFEFTDVEFVDR
jgi:PAS domain S-box-containing protein